MRKIRRRIIALIAALGVSIVSAYFGEKLYPRLILPHPTAPHNGKADLSSDAYVTVWPANDHDNLSRPYPSAPPIAFRIEPTDVADWWVDNGNHPRHWALDDGSPKDLALQVSSPSFASPQALSATVLCPRLPLDDCLIGSARMVVDRDDLDLGREDVLFGRKPPQVEPGSFGQARDGMLEYWTYDAGIGHGVKWLGWDCSIAAKPNSPAVFDVTGSPLLTKYQGCYSPDPQTSPWGKRRHMALNRLWIWHGEFLFTYRNRYVHTDEEIIPSERTNPGAARALLFFSAWEMLNRMESNAIAAPVDSPELETAQVQSMLCKTTGDAAQKWNADLEAQYPVAGENAETASLNTFLRSQALGRVRARFHSMALGCQYVLDVAKRHTAEAAAQLVPLLATVERAELALSQIDATGYDRIQPALEAWIAAISAASGPHSSSLLEPVVEQIHYSRLVNPGSPEAANLKTKLARAESLLDLLPSGLSDDDRLRLYIDMAARYGYLQDYEKQIAMLERECDDLRAHHGNQASQLLVPLHERMIAMWRAKDVNGSRSSLNDLQTLWQALPKDAPDLPSEKSAAGWPMIGFDIVYFRTLAAFNQGNFAQAAGEIDEVIQTLEERLGKDSPFVAAARFHLDEVRRQRRLASNVRGGGFLPAGMN